MYSSIQEQEDHEYRMGMASELQNALALSNMQREPDDTAKIDELVASGRHVVVSERPVFCPRTDACMGSHKMLMSDHPTRHEAEIACRELDDADAAADYYEGGNYVLPELVADTPYVSGHDDSEIPF